MKQTIYSLFLLALFGMTGMQAWADDLTTTEIDGVTYYEIGTAADLVAFAELVNGGEFGANAILTADIDMTGIAWEAPIAVITGEENKDVGPGAYTGIFDGQGHKISGFVAEGGTPGHIGLFGDANGATIKNFSISGKLQVLGGHGAGVIAYPASSTIQNVHSSLEITIPEAIPEESGACHVGGVVGSARGSNTISKCTFNGTLTIGLGNTDCHAGVVGYVAGDSISFCANYGTINYEEQGCAAGGVVGYVNNTNSYVQNCLNIGNLVYNDPDPDLTPKWGGAIVGRLRNHDLAMMTGNVWLEGSATAAGKDNDGNVNLTQASCVTAAQLASGEACYLLNGNQAVIGWYQTLPADEQPTLDATHAQVYLNARKHCNGDLYEGYTYSNEYTEIIQDEHNMVDGVCDYCGFFDENVIANSMVLNDEGFYEISNGPQLLWFAKYVAKDSENADANAILTADIDLDKMLSSNTWVPIGSNNIPYKGTFDGKGFTISNFIVTTNTDYYGLFGKLAGGAAIKNFTIDGSINSLNQWVGVIGGGGGGTINISDIHSYLNIKCSKSRHAGILGYQSSTGTINIDRCWYSGTLDAGNTTGNLGGIMALTQNSTSAYVNITDCLFDGTILDGTGSNAGGILGYANRTRVTIKNCLSVGTVISTNPSPFIGQLNASNSKWAGNNYYTTEGNLVGLPGEGVTVSGPEPVETSEDQLASGEVCWNLNEEKFFDSSWRQTLEVEPYPLPTGEGDYVYEFSTGLENINDDNIGEIILELSSEGNEFLDQIEYAYQPLIDAYKAEIDSWEDIETMEAFFASYQTALELMESINTSAKAYDAYIETCENAIAYIDENELEGEWTDFLRTYLEQDVNPNNNYPNGSYNYILENMQLDNDALAGEKAFVEQMLANAIAGGLTAGTEITRMLTNSTFSEGLVGWTTENDESVALATGGVTSIMPIARGLGNGAFSISQTLTELPEGVYMMTTNAMFRACDDYDSKYYAGQIFMNNTANYVMTAGEDVLAQSATGMIEYVGDDAAGYVPNNMNGASYAFNAGHYQNFCATKVTDGTLTVGVRNLNNGLGNQWLPFGNMHIYYLGTEDEADEDLSAALESFYDRAARIIDFESSEDPNDPNDYQKKPNCSQALKDALDVLNSKADSLLNDVELEQGESKLMLINTYSDLFNEVLACRKAYTAMLDAANMLAEFIGTATDLGFMSEDDFDNWDTEIQDALTHFLEGDITTDEARAITDRLNGCEFMMKSVDGVYQLETALDLAMFSNIVNSGKSDAKAVLTADIDMSEVMGSIEEDEEPLGIYMPIGFSDTTPFTGTFDGQGYAITNFYYKASGNWNGLFGYVSNATIKDFSISGKLTSDGYNYNGTIGQAEGTSIISGIYSDMTINVANFKAHSGGIVGGMSTSSKMEIHNCEYAGTFTHSGAGDCQAGICGYTYAGGIFNCVFSGTIIGQTNKYGGILGYCKVPGFKGVQNCLSVGKIIANEGCTTAAAIIANWNGDATQNVKNNYYCMKEGTSECVVPIGNKKQSCEAPYEVNETQLASGEVCFKLNGDQSVINWYQTINEDAYPVPFERSEQVFFNEEENFYYNLINGIPVGIKQIESSEPKVQVKLTGIYNLAGQRLEKLQRGINIVDGKKILVK